MMLAMADPKLPTVPPSTAKLRAADLALLEEDARRFVVRDRPASDALWTALLKPRDAVLAEYRATLQKWAESDPGANTGILGGVTGGPPSILAMASATVAKAMLGDLAAAAQVMARIEGLPTPRKLDDGEAGEARAQMVSGIEALVRAMNRKGDDAQVINADPVVPDEKT